MRKDYLTLALAKGRLGKSLMKEIEENGKLQSIDLDSRKLIFFDDKNKIRYMVVKPIDVITYVEKGVADLGVVGRDNLLEAQGDLYELLDLGFGKCKFSIAGVKGQKLYQKDSILKIATKYPNVAMKYFQSKQQKIDIIKLNGSVELAPLVGLADVIVDIVETGHTIKANGLEILEDMFDISAKLIANRVSYRFKQSEINKLCDLLEGRNEDD